MEELRGAQKLVCSADNGANGATERKGVEELLEKTVCRAAKTRRIASLVLRIETSWKMDRSLDGSVSGWIETSCCRESRGVRGCDERAVGVRN